MYEPDNVNAPWNKFTENAEVIKAVLCGALYPNIAMYEFDSNGGKWCDARGDLSIGSASVIHDERSSQTSYAVFHEKMKTFNRVQLRECTMVNPFALLLFGNLEIRVKHEENLIIVDNWIYMRAAAQVAVLFKETRNALLTDLKKQVSQVKDRPSNDCNIVSTIARLLEEGART